MQPRTRWLVVISILALALSFIRSGGVVSAKPKPTPMMGMGHSGKPNMNVPTKQVAPAVTAMLMPAGAACSSKVKGGGTVKMIPVHVGRMSGPHVNLVINLHGAKPMHMYGIGGAFRAKPPIYWSHMEEVDRTDMMGSLHVMTRLMPMMRPGRYTAQIFLSDMGCGMMNHHPVAYETRLTRIELR